MNQCQGGHKGQSCHLCHSDRGTLTKHQHASMGSWCHMQGFPTTKLRKPQVGIPTHPCHSTCMHTSLQETPKKPAIPSALRLGRGKRMAQHGTPSVHAAGSRHACGSPAPHGQPRPSHIEEPRLQRLQYHCTQELAQATSHELLAPPPHAAIKPLHVALHSSCRRTWTDQAVSNDSSPTSPGFTALLR